MRTPAGPRSSGCIRALLIACFTMATSMPSFASPANVWRSAGPDGGWTRSLAVAPSDPSVVYAGGSGVYRSVDGGATWSEADGGIDGLEVDGQIGDIAVDPLDPSLAYAATGQGLYRTTEGGRHWDDVSPVSLSSYSSVVIDPTDHHTVYAGDGVGGVFRSPDGGATWSRIGDSLPQYEVSAIVVDPANPATIYVGIIFGGVFKTTDGGVTWTAVLTNPDIVDDLAIDPAQTQTLYAGEDLFGIWKTEDGGATWTEMDEGVRGIRARVLAVDPQQPSTVYAGGDSTSLSHPRGFGIFKTTDAGESWAPANGGLTDADVWSLAVDPSSPAVLYAGTMTFGVFKTTDGGQSWTWTAAGIVGTEVYSLGADPSNPDVVYGGLSMGVSVSRSAGRRWSLTGKPPAIARVTAVAVDPITPGIVYAGTRDRGAYRSTDSGHSWTAIDEGLHVEHYPVVSVPRMVVDPSQTTTVYAAVTFIGESGQFDTVYKTIDSGAHWQPANDGLPEGFYGDIPLVLDPSNPLDLFASVEGSGLYKSVDGAATWYRVGSGLPTDVNGLAIDPASPQQLYASVEFGLYRSVDGGSTWHEADAGLPPAQVWNIAVDPARPGTAYAGGSPYGVYATVDGGHSWMPLNAGLRNKAIESLVADAGGSNLFAATIGGGVFVFPIG